MSTSLSKSAVHSLGLLSLCLLFATVHAGVANITLYFDTQCERPGTEFFPLLNNAGNCTTTSQFTGVNPTYLDIGCTVTVYSDPYCSNNATEVKASTCSSIASGTSISSFSVDDCEFTDADDWNRPSASASTSVIAAVSTSTPSSDASGTSLSTGSKAGIITGSVVGFLIIAAAVLFTIIKLRKRRSSRAGAIAEGNSESQPGNPSVKLELPEDNLSKSEKYAELDGGDPPELDSSHQRYELEDPRHASPVYEMDAPDSQQQVHQQCPPYTGGGGVDAEREKHR